MNERRCLRDRPVMFGRYPSRLAALSIRARTAGDTRVDEPRPESVTLTADAETPTAFATSAIMMGFDFFTRL